MSIAPEPHPSRSRRRRLSTWSTRSPLHRDYITNIASSRIRGIQSLFMAKARFRERVLIYFSTIILLPILTLGIVAPILYSRSVAELSARYTRDMVERVTHNLELTIRDQEKLLDMILQDEMIGRFFLSRPEHQAGQPSSVSVSAGMYEMHAEVSEATARGSDDETELITRLFRATMDSHPEIAGMIAVTKSGRFVASDLERIMRDPLPQEDWFVQASTTPGDFSLVTRPIGRNLRNPSGIGPDEIVSVIKSIDDPETGTFAGVLMVDLSLDYLEDSFQGLSRGESAFYMIVDGNEEIVYAPVNSIVYRINPDWFTNSSQIVERTIDNRGYRFIFAESPYMGWKTIGVYYLDEALQPVRFVQMSALIIALVTIALTVVISMVYSTAISKPVLHLRSVMERAGHGDLDVRYDGNSRDEIDDLGQGLNSMLDRIQTLLDLVYTEQKAKHEAELRILQQQIKPHFLYNTLDTILWMAEEKGHDQIAEAVMALTRLFRIALSQGREMISLGDEIDHVRSYLTIQKLRYEEKFDFSVECPENLTGLQVQKMILQPLVENAIYHGIKEKSGSGTIRVNIAENADVLELTVADDGVGIPAAELAQISQGLSHVNHEPDRTAFALYNVNDRISLTYGDEYGITVVSSENRGTDVTIRHPIIREKV